MSSDMDRIWEVPPKENMAVIRNEADSFRLQSRLVSRILNLPISPGEKVRFIEILKEFATSNWSLGIETAKDWAKDTS